MVDGAAIVLFAGDALTALRLPALTGTPGMLSLRGVIGSCGLHSRMHLACILIHVGLANT
jgi:hypothetical protein